LNGAGKSQEEMMRRFGWELADLAEIQLAVRSVSADCAVAIRHQWATGNCHLQALRIVLYLWVLSNSHSRYSNCNGDLGDCPVKLPPDELELLGIKRNVN
jgi:hypothetical protein